MNFANFNSKQHRNRNKKLEACWLAATKKQFYGTGATKLSRAEIEAVNVASVCDDIKGSFESNEIENYYNIYIPSTLAYGALRILEKQMDFFQEKCQATLTRLLIPDEPTKLSKKKKTDLNDTLYEKEIEEIDLKPLFKKRKDKHLLPEEDYQLPIDTSYGLHFCDLEELSSITSGIFSTSEVPEVVNNITTVDKSVTPKQTPKRPPRTSHDETPSKRPRTDKSSTPTSLSKTAEATTAREHISGPRVSERLHSNVRRSIFPPGQIEADEDQVMQQGHSRGIMQETSVVEANDFAQEGPPRGLVESSKNIPHATSGVEEPVDQSVPQEPDVHAFPQPPVVQEIPADDVVVDNVQRAHSRIRENRQDEEMMELPELNDSLITPRQRKRKRRFVFADAVKTINIKENIDDPRNSLIHVQEKTQAKLKNKKFLPVKELLSLPFVGLKLLTCKNKIRCFWGGILVSRFFKMIETPCPDYEETGARESPRNPAVGERRRRRTIFTVPERSATSNTISDSVKSAQQSIPSVYANVEDQPEYQDFMLMPPPPQPPLEEQPPSTPGRDEQARPPTTPGRGERTPRSRLGHLDSSAAVSPRQSGRPSGADHSPHEPQVASESPVAAHVAVDGASFQRHQRSTSRTPDYYRAQLESPRTERGKYFMKEEEFDKFLEKIWTILKNKSFYKELKFDLKIILVPDESACEEIVVYFNYLCEFEKQEKLQIKQDEPYSTVSIEKLD